MEKIIILLIFTSPILLGVMVVLLQNWYKNLVCNYHKKHQHRMFNQLKKGDYMWKLEGDFIYPCRISNVTYSFGNKDEVRTINIHFGSYYSTIRLKPEEARSFKYHDVYDYFTLFEEAETIRSLSEMKRKRSIEGITATSSQEVANALKKEIDTLEKLKEDAIKKLTVKLD